MKRLFTSILSLFLLAATLFFFSCGGKGNTVLSTGSDATLTALSVSPATASIAVGETQQFIATGTYSDNSTHIITSNVTWGSSDTTVATISASGLATAISTGATTITAVTGTVPGNAALTVASPGNGSTTPAIAGFSFALHEGDIWEYGWKKHETSFSITGSTNVTSKSYFRITLGAPVTIQSITAYPLHFSGSTIYVKGRWSHVALANNIFYGSSNGTTLKEIFNAQTGLVDGNGFFSALGSLCEASPGSISNDFIGDTNVYVLRMSTDNSQCQYYPGIGTICGDSGSSQSKREYYKTNVGPVGYYNYFAYSSGSGMDSFSATTTEDIGLVKSSLRGDVIDYVLEEEPNNTPATALSLTLPAKASGNAYGDSATGAQKVYLNTTDEVEPNDGPLSALTPTQQIIVPPILVTGNTATGDPGTAVNLSVISAGTPTIEDWYRITLPSSGIVHADLDFTGGTPADLDLYLFSLSGSSLTIQKSSLVNNLAFGAAQKESLTSTSLAAGTYLIAVDAYDTQGQRETYTLNVYIGNAKNEVTVYDWYRVALSADQMLVVSSTNGWSVVLTDSTGTTTLANSSPAAAGGAAGFTSPLLTAGTYYIGMGYTTNVQGQYVLDVSAH